MSAKENHIDSPIFRRRQRRKDHFHQLDKTIVFAYPTLSDGAKMTYVVLDSYDWPGNDGTCKGYVYPYQTTLAQVRGISVRTVRRHLQELVDVGLITVETTPTPQGRRNIYWIEEPTEEEFNRYLETIKKPPSNAPAGGEDKNVRTHEDKFVPHKDINTKDIKRQDKTLSGPVPSVDKNPVKEEELNLSLIKIRENFGRPLSKSERKFLFRLLREHGSEDVDFAIGELELQKELRPIQNPLRYIKGVLKNWEREGRRLTDMFSHLERVRSLEGAAISA